MGRGNLRKIYAKLRIFLGNGQSFLNDFRYPIFLAIALRVYIPQATYTQLGLITLAIVIILAFVGWVDLRYVRIAQTQAELQTEKYNPYFAKLKRKLSKKKFK